MGATCYPKTSKLRTLGEILEHGAERGQSIAFHIGWETAGALRFGQARRTLFLLAARGAEDES